MNQETKTDEQHIAKLNWLFRLANTPPKITIRYDYDRQLYHRVFEIKAYFLSSLGIRNMQTNYRLVAVYAVNNKAIRAIIVPKEEYV